jgi:hypothetical protein
MDTQELLTILAPIIVIQIALQIYALYDIYKRQGAKDNRTLLWVVVVLVFNFPGIILYFVLGRKEETDA